MAESISAMKVDPLGVRPHEPLTRYKREAEERAESEAREQRIEERARRERERQAQQQESDVVEALRQEIADIRTEAKMRSDVTLEVTADEVAKCADRILDEVERKIRDVESKLYALVEGKFARLEGRLDGALDAARSGRSFKKFANEALEPADVDIPNWRKTTH
jgi:hypothetical protein